MAIEILRKYDADPEDIFSKIVEICHRNGLKIHEINHNIHRIIFKTGMSAFSFGETYALFLKKEKGHTIVHFEGNPKLGINITGHTKANNTVHSIIETLDNIFQK